MKLITPLIHYSSFKVFINYYFKDNKKTSKLMFDFEYFGSIYRESAENVPKTVKIYNFHLKYFKKI